MWKVCFLFFLTFGSGVAHGAASPIVIYFGGAASTKKVLDECFPSFRNYAHPTSETELISLIKEINKNPDQEYILVGHSAGSLSAMSLSSNAEVTNKSRLTLVNLDGNAPYRVPKSVRRICWRATNGVLNSRNYESMDKQKNCSEVNTYSAPNCTSPWCLHFSIVNLTVKGDLKEWATKGYQGCSEEQLEWLHPLMPTKNRYPPPINKPTGGIR